MLSEDASVVLPSAYVGKIVGAHYESKGVFRLPFPECIQGPDGIMRLRHTEFDVIYLDFQFGMSLDCLDCGFESVPAAVAADAVLKRILWGYYQIYAVKSCLFGHVLHDGEMAFVQGIE